jgi:hypothetical protein
MVERPARVLGYDWVFVFGKFLECSHKLCISAVPHGDHGIAAQAGEFRAAHRRSAQDCTKFFRLHLSQPVKPGIDQAFPRLKFFGGGNWRFAVPWTNVLADITTKNMPPYARAQVFGNLAALLDR